jgi:hypothetical protein
VIPLWALLLLGAWGFVNLVIFCLFAASLIMATFREDDGLLVHLDDYRRDRE